MALWVVVGHWSTTAPILPSIGHTKLYNGYAVDVFIFLSGLAITIMIMNRRESYQRYITRRFLRIFPVYLFFLIISVLISDFALEVWKQSPEGGYMNARRTQIAYNSIEYFWPHLYAHLVALHGIIPPRILPDTDYAFLGQAWSISLEWQFYLIAPFIIPIFLNGPKKYIIIMLLMTIIVVLAVRFSVQMPQGFLGNAKNILNFYVGIASAIALKKINDGLIKVNRVSVISMLVACIALTCASFVTVKFIPYSIWLWSMWTIICSNYYTGGRFSNSLSRFLNCRPIQKLGSMSYSVYLSHMIVLIFLLYVVQLFGIESTTAQSIFLILALIPTTLIISYVTYSYIELPFHNFGRKLWKKPSAEAVTQPTAPRLL